MQTRFFRIRLYFIQLKRRKSYQVYNNVAHLEHYVDVAFMILNANTQR